MRSKNADQQKARLRAALAAGPLLTGDLAAAMGIPSYKLFVTLAKFVRDGEVCQSLVDNPRRRGQPTYRWWLPERPPVAGDDYVI